MQLLYICQCSSEHPIFGDIFDNKIHTQSIYKGFMIFVYLSYLHSGFLGYIYGVAKLLYNYKCLSNSQLCLCRPLIKIEVWFLMCRFISSMSMYSFCPSVFWLGYKSHRYILYMYKYIWERDYLRFTVFFVKIHLIYEHLVIYYFVRRSFGQATKGIIVCIEYIIELIFVIIC